MNWATYWTWYWQIIIAVLGLWIIFSIFWGAFLRARRELEKQNQTFLDDWRDANNTDPVIFSGKGDDK